MSPFYLVYDEALVSIATEMSPAVSKVSWASPGVPPTRSTLPSPADPAPLQFDSYLPVSVLRVVYPSSEESMRSLAHVDQQTPLPMPRNTNVFSAIQRQGTPVTCWTHARPAFDNSCFASPQAQQIPDDIPDIRPPRMPRK